MSARIFLVAACLLAVAGEAAADHPVSVGQVTAVNLPDSAASNQYSGAVRMRTTEGGSLLFEYVEGVAGAHDYTLVGETDDGTYVLHRVDRSDRYVAVHELLFLKPVSAADSVYDEKHHSLADRLYVIEKLETIPVDAPNDAVIEIEDNAILVTIAAP